MLHIGCDLIASEEDAEGALRFGARCFQFGSVFLPLLTLDIYLDLYETLVVAHCVIIHETDLEGRLATFRTTCPKGETIGGSLLDGDTEETFVLETCELIAVARVFEAYIVRITLERSSFTSKFPKARQPIRCWGNSNERFFTISA